MSLFTRNFNILVAGAFVKSAGSGIYSIAGMLLVLQLTGDVFYSGITYFIISLPGVFGFLISPFSNYVPYKRALIFCEGLKALLVVSVPLLFFSGSLHVWYVIGIMFTLALLTQFTYPIESTLLPLIAGQDQILKANSVLNTVRESMDILFLTLAGVMIAAIGTSTSLLITSGCHVLIAGLYTFFRINKFQPKPVAAQTPKILLNTYWQDLKEGIVYVKGSILPHIIVGAVVANFFVGGMIAALPAFALEIGHTEAYYGYYLVAMSVGLLLGSFSTPLLKSIPYGLISIVSTLATGSFWILAALTPVPFSIVSYGIGFISLSMFNIIIFSMIQQKLQQSMLGRTITILSSSASLAIPLGSLVGGGIASLFGTRYPILLGGVGLLLFSLYWFFHPTLRRLPVTSQLELFHTKINEDLPQALEHNKDSELLR